MTASDLPPRNDRLVCHYTSLATALEYILPEQQLRLSPVERMNDPRDAKEWTPVLGWSGTRDSDPPHDEMDKARSRFKDVAQRLVKMACFTRDAELDDEGQGKTAKECHEIHRRGFGRLRMWSQYGDSHRGVCLVFDKERLCRTLRVTYPTAHFSDVTYRDWISDGIDRSSFEYDDVRTYGLDAAIGRHIENNVNALYYTKAMDWRSESEWRIVLRSTHTGFEFLSTRDCLLSVILGCDVAPAYYASLRGSAPSGVGVRPLHWDAELGQLVLGRLI